MATVITAGAYTLAALGEYAAMPATIVPFLTMLLGLLVLAHLAVRLFAHGAEPTLLPLAAILHGLGYVMIHAARRRVGRSSNDLERRRRRRLRGRVDRRSTGD